MDLSPGCGPCSGLYISSGLSVAFWEPLESAVLDYYPQVREPLWKSGSTGEKFRHTVRERGNKKKTKNTNTKLSAVKRVRGIIWLCSCDLFPVGAQCTAKGDFLGPQFLPPGVSESVRAWEYMHLVPQLCGMLLPKVSISPLPQSEYWVQRCLQGPKRWGDWQRGISRGH